MEREVSNPEVGVLNKLSVAWVLEHFDEFEQDIIVLRIVDGLTYDEIGRAIGAKYREQDLSGSAIRYHMKKIMKRLRSFAKYLR